MERATPMTLTHLSLAAAVLCVPTATAHADSVVNGTLARSAVYPFRVEPAPLSAVGRARITGLQPDSDAARGGLREGDTILTVNGQAYTSLEQVRRLLLRASTSRPIALSVDREGRARTVHVPASPAPLEAIPGVTSHYDVLETTDGARLRTITTRPTGRAGDLAGIYFVQWLSCDSIERPLNLEDHGWQTMIELLASRSNAVVMRTEKAGVGDSEGPACNELDYETDLSHHRQGLRRFRETPGVDPRRVVIFGASMGGNMATLLARETPPAGLVIWGTALKSWFEHLVEFNRRHMELSGRPPAEIAPAIGRLISFFHEYLVQGRSPHRIAAVRPDLADAWREVRGMTADAHYGRPFTFHQQAQRQDWVGALASLRVPALILYGEYDWFEALDDLVLGARLVARNGAHLSRLVVIPRTSHHFFVHPSLKHSFEARDGMVAPQPVIVELVAWLRETGLDPAS